MPLHLDGRSRPGPQAIDWQKVALGYEKRITELEAALSPFVDNLERTEAVYTKVQLAHVSDGAEIYDGVVWGDLRRARDLLRHS